MEETIRKLLKNLHQSKGKHKNITRSEIVRINSSYNKDNSLKIS